MRTNGAVLLVCVVIGVAGVLAKAESVSYALSQWSCGVIIWRDGLPGNADEFAVRLSEAARTVFEFWGSTIPAVTNWPYDLDEALHIYDPAIGLERAIPPLLWGDREILPVVVFAFPNEDGMRSALGETGLFGATFSAFPMGDVFPNAEPWFWEVGTGYRNVICPSTAEEETLIHELAHWFTYQWCYPRGIVPYHLPSYIIEGIAQLTSAVVRDDTSMIFDRLGAVSWATKNCLTGSIQGVMRYAVGESLVEYLVDALGHEGFLNSLREWSMRAWFLIDTHEDDWRTSLGLPPECSIESE
ncbi:hypothetical protein ACFLSZ_06200 [Candidatus Bipolaricaulota bacterium]